MKMVFSSKAITFAAVHSIKSLQIPITGTVVLLCFLLLIIILKMENLDVLFCPTKQSLTLWSVWFHISLSGTRNFPRKEEENLHCSFLQILTCNFQSCFWDTVTQKFWLTGSWIGKQTVEISCGQSSNWYYTHHYKNMKKWNFNLAESSE